MRRPESALAIVYGPRRDRILVDDLVERLRLAVGAHAPLAREHGQRPDVEDRVVRAVREVEADGAVVQDHRALDAVELRTDGRRGALARQHVVRMLDVGGRDRVAVVEARLGMQPERDRRPVWRHQHFLGEQAVDRARLVARAHGERLEHQDAHASRLAAFERKRIVLVEARAPVGVAEIERAALGGVGIDVVEVLEVAGIFGIPVGGERVRPRAGGGGGRFFRGGGLFRAGASFAAGVAQALAASRSGNTREQSGPAARRDRVEARIIGSALG